MAKIQLVIEIEERLYKNIIDNDMDDEEFEAIDDAFWNAKPLPKGHGRIADIDKVLEEMKATKTYDIPFALERVKPIIEADTESEGTNVSSS